MEDKQYIITCLHRFLGHCKNCIRDYDPQHHPNNKDCCNYLEIKMLCINILDKTEDKTPYDFCV